jgi:hypothetical protein
MTNTVTDYYQNSLLSEAAYADFTKMIVTNTDGSITYNNDILKNTLKDEEDGCGFSAVQAKAFASKYSVVSHIPNTASGFSAT